MPTRNVVITERQASFVERMVVDGRYQNASEVLREGLRLVEQREAENAAKLKALHEAIQVGIDDIEEGRYTVLKTPAETRAHFKAIAGKVFAET